MAAGSVQEMHPLCGGDIATLEDIDLLAASAGGPVEGGEIRRRSAFERTHHCPNELDRPNGIRRGSRLCAGLVSRERVRERPLPTRERASQTAAGLVYRDLDHRHGSSINLDWDEPLVQPRRLQRANENRSTHVWDGLDGCVIELGARRGEFVDRRN